MTAVRSGYGLSQEEFALLLGISVRTLQNWEQGVVGPMDRLASSCGLRKSTRKRFWIQFGRRAEETDWSGAQLVERPSSGG